MLGKEVEGWGGRTVYVGVEGHGLCVFCGFVRRAMRLALGWRGGFCGGSLCFLAERGFFWIRLRVEEVASGPGGVKIVYEQVM